MHARAGFRNSAQAQHQLLSKAIDIPLIRPNGNAIGTKPASALSPTLSPFA